MLDDVIFLIEKKESRTENGYNEPTETRRKVFAKKESPMRTEFYAAAQAGMRISGDFIVNTDDYKNEQIVEHDEKRLRVVRSYPINRVFTKLIVMEEL